MCKIIVLTGFSSSVMHLDSEFSYRWRWVWHLACLEYTVNSYLQDFLLTNSIIISYVTIARINLSTSHTLASSHQLKFEKRRRCMPKSGHEMYQSSCPPLFSENLILWFLVEMITGFDHGYWLTSPISTWPQTSWASTFPCLLWLLLQPCRKWPILMVRANVQ